MAVRLYVKATSDEKDILFSPLRSLLSHSSSRLSSFSISASISSISFSLFFLSFLPAFLISNAAAVAAMADPKFDSAVDPTTIQINGVDGTAEEDQGAYIAENRELKEKIKRLSEQIDKLEKDLAAEEGRVLELLGGKNESTEDKKALAAISARAAELETDLFRLQHDYFSATSERDDLFGKLERLEVAFEDVRRANREMDSKIEILEQEKTFLGKEMARLIRESEEVMKGKVLEMREVENEKAVLEERLKELGEKSEGLEKSLKEFKVKNLELEEKVVALARQLEKEEEGKEYNKNEKKERNLKFAWPVATTVATGAAAAAIFYLKYARQGKGRD